MFKVWFTRSYTPLVAGFLGTWALKLKAPIDGEMATAAAVAFITIIYGTVAHWLELVKGSKWGKWLLGSGILPTYKEN